MFQLQKLLHTIHIKLQRRIFRNSSKSCLWEKPKMVCMYTFQINFSTTPLNKPDIGLSEQIILFYSGIKNLFLCFLI